MPIFLNSGVPISKLAGNKKSLNIWNITACDNKDKGRLLNTEKKLKPIVKRKEIKQRLKDRFLTSD